MNQENLSICTGFFSTYNNLLDAVKSNAPHDWTLDLQINTHSIELETEFVSRGHKSHYKLLFSVNQVKIINTERGWSNDEDYEHSTTMMLHVNETGKILAQSYHHTWDEPPSAQVKTDRSELTETEQNTLLSFAARETKEILNKRIEALWTELSKHLVLKNRPIFADDKTCLNCFVLMHRLSRARILNAENYKKVISYQDFAEKLSNNFARTPLTQTSFDNAIQAIDRQLQAEKVELANSLGSFFAKNPYADSRMLDEIASFLPQVRV